MWISRIISLIIAGIYISITFLVNGLDSEQVPTIGCLFFALSFIWFAQNLAECSGLTSWFQTVDSSPEVIVRFLGWIMLLFLPPLIIIIFKTVNM